MSSAEQVRRTYQGAVTALGYLERDREVDEVIDLLGVEEDGSRFGRLAGFYPTAMVDAVDLAAQTAREFPEALLADAERRLLDLIMQRGTW